MAKITSSDRDEDIGLISFNYDTLLDQAITEHRKVSLTSLEAYKRENYVKPHGSINWFLGTRSEDPFPPREVTFDRGTRIKFSAQHMFNGPPLDLDKLEMLDANHEDLIRLENLDKLFQRFDPKYFYPLVLVPLLTKLYPHINQLNELIINEGKKLLSQASEIFFIGYQASDEVIFEMLEDIQYGVPLHVIGNKAGSTNQIMKKTLEHPVVQGRLTEGILYSDGFAQFVDSSKF
ncbi:MAG: hypothetical protein JWM56_308 [Candidatus Peribacteria bacterium]|nr:hypothetical protein [Candidatus Peribacteria bacterium]